MAKHALTADVLDSQTAVELPDREMMALVTIVITNLLNNNTVTVDLRNIDVAVQVCAVALSNNSNVDCQIAQP